MAECETTVVDLPLCVVAGDSYQFSLLWQDESNQPIDLTGYTAKMQARPSAQAEDPPSFEKTESDGITLGGAAGTIDVLLAPADTDQLNANQVWDIQLTSPTGFVTTLAGGAFSITRDVTR